MDRRKCYEHQFLVLLAKAMKQQHKSKDQEKITIQLKETERYRIEVKNSDRLELALYSQLLKNTRF
ncbi:hypothetical protein ABD86_05065 [Paenibacillus alvei]|nr:hypothetical protein [Paenibacillus alvei]MBG9743334.1 hypothetical protein [Paenibacillus alvei]